mmetsp:Transcript_118461/g.330450  ORF Transcript_118461/g.330450 Transcript_118461/m.330450 type:complete len:207 (+) Transcript_118461:96-716(+)
MVTPTGAKCCRAATKCGQSWPKCAFMCPRRICLACFTRLVSTPTTPSTPPTSTWQTLCICFSPMSLVWQWANVGLTTIGCFLRARRKSPCFVDSFEWRAHAARASLSTSASVTKPRASHSAVSWTFLRVLTKSLPQRALLLTPDVSASTAGQAQRSNSLSSCAAGIWWALQGTFVSARAVHTCDRPSRRGFYRWSRSWLRLMHLTC